MRIQKIRKRLFSVLFTAGTVGLLPLTGCTNLNNALPQTFGINSGARVPPPGTGAFAPPTNYTQGTGAAGAGATSSGVPQPNNNGLGGPRTSLFNPIEQPTGQLLSSLNQAQSQLQNVTNQARNSINRTADNINSRVEAASGRIDRLGQGVVQAGAVLSEAVQSPVVPAYSEEPVSSDGSTNVDTNASWRRPTTR